MDWVQDMTARWVRIMSAADSGRTPLDEAVRELSAIADTSSAKKGARPSLFRRSSPAAEDPFAVTALCRQLIAGVLVSDLAIERLCAVENRSRPQVLAELTADEAGQLRDQQLRALQAELSGSWELLRDPERASYSGLGVRIEQLLRLAEQQASDLVDAARAEADRITASAGAAPATPGSDSPATPTLDSGQDDSGRTADHRL
ncbi:MAG TPA: hypothetical protein VGG16_28965 [Streptosporangiaceae bacterium]|jgi:hypothetical protein